MIHSRCQRLLERAESLLCFTTSSLFELGASVCGVSVGFHQPLEVFTLKTKTYLDIRDHAKPCEKTNDTRITGWVRMRDRVRVGLRSRGGVRVLGLAD